MYKKQIPSKSTIQRNNSQSGETIEQKMFRVITNKEPIKDGAPLVYTERKDGVKPAYNIRTDRFEIAIDAMDVVSKSITAKRDYKAQMNVIKDSGAESSTGTNEQ